MRIVEYVCKNMIELGDLHITDMSRDIIQIIGLNGSGKSLLMSTLHPYAKSGRFDRAYPIKQGMSGYKKVVYEDREKLIITEHEYTPKNDTHSAKSYLTIIENGQEINLNPTGHRDLYVELVDKYLHYNSKVENIAHLSESFNGITNSTPLDRKKIVESTIDSERIAMLKKNVVDTLRDKKGATKGLTQYKIQLLSSKDEKEERVYLSNIESNIEELENTTIPALMNEKAYIESKLNGMKNDYNDVDIYELSQVIELLKEGNYDILSMAKERFITIGSQIEIKKQELSHIKEKIDTQELYKKTYNDVAQITARMKAQENDLILEKEKYLNIVTREITTEEANILKDKISVLKELGSDIREFNIQREDVIKITDDIKSYIDELSNKIKLYTDSVEKFKKMSSSIIQGDGYSDIPYESNCDRCSLYKAYVTDKKWIEDNKSLYNSWIDALSYTESLKRAMMEYYNTDIKECLDYIKDIVREDVLLRTNTADLVNGLIMGSYDQFVDTYNLIRETGSVMLAMERMINDYKERIKDLHHEFDEDSYNKLIESKDNIVSELNKLNEEYNFLFKYKPILSMSNSLSVKTVEDLIYIRETKISFDNSYKEYKTKLLNVTDKITRAQKDLNILTGEKARVKEVIRNLDSTNKTLLTYNREIKELDILKNILEKDIPFYLLREHLEYIEEKVNFILDGLFPYSISIKVEEDEIVISVLRHRTNRITNDVRNCSSGEKTIIGLLLNSAVLNILGYSVLCLDEVDAQLDELFKSKFSTVIHEILSVFNIDQVFCISHNLGSHIQNSITLTLGDVSSLNIIGETKKVY